MKSGRLRSETRRVSEVEAATRDAMWHLFERYYADVTRATFDADLAKKTHVILLFDSGDQSLQGFSNVQVYRTRVDGRFVQVVFSGDTIVERAYWGQGTAQRAYSALYLRLKLARPFEPLYYFLLSKGYKTYLLLTRSFVDHWPRHDRPMPAREKAILDALSREKYGALYDAEHGIVRMPSAAGRLKEDIAPITPALLRDPEIRFFAEKNPGHVHAEELCCLAEVTFTAPVRYVATRLARRLRGASGTLVESAR